MTAFGKMSRIYRKKDTFNVKEEVKHYLFSVFFAKVYYICTQLCIMLKRHGDVFLKCASYCACADI